MSNTSSTPSASTSSSTDQTADIRLVSPSERDAAARILASATGQRTPEAALLQIADDEGTGGVLLGAYLGGEMIAAYTIRKDGMANQIGLIAVHENYRRRGIGRSLLHDALLRSGRRPVTIETDEAGLPFYKACGFKVFGRRPQPSGAVRWRLGWHAPHKHGSGESQS